MASGQASKSSGSQESGASSLSVFPFLLGQAFGLPSMVNRTGGLNFGTPGAPSNVPSFFGGSQFTPQQLAPFTTLADPINSFSVGQQGLNLVPALGGEALRGAQNSLNFLNQSVVPTANNLLQTGGFDQARALATEMFSQDILPQILEAGGQLGLNANDSDLQGILAREGNRMSLQAASDAINRQTSLLPFSAELSQLMGQAVPSTASGLFGFEAQARAAERAATPGGQLLDLFNVLSGYNTQGQSFSRGQENSKGGGAGIGS